jgi:hypothetical protein
MEPWGFQMFGHHVCINCAVVGAQVTLSPIFLGAEPRIIEDGPRGTLRSFDAEIELGFEFMRSLSDEERAAATIVDSMIVGALPPGLDHPTEGRMRGAVARDNAVVPYEGVVASSLDDDQRARLVRLIEQFIHRSSDDQAAKKMDQVLAHLDETHFAWVGALDDVSPIYYKVHSPVLFIELDSHPGIFLSNDVPERFHIHTIVRSPNGNDYGRAHILQAQAHAAANGAVA